LPRIRRPDVIAPAEQLLEHAAPTPAPEVAPVVAMAAPIGTGKTRSPPPCCGAWGRIIEAGRWSPGRIIGAGRWSP